MYTNHEQMYKVQYNKAVFYPLFVFERIEEERLGLYIMNTKQTFSDQVIYK